MNLASQAASPRLETASSIRFVLVEPSDPLLGGERQLLGTIFKSVLNETKDKTHATSFYLFGAGAGSAVEDGCSSALSSVVVCSRGFSELDEEAAGAGGAVTPTAEAADEGCVAAGAVLGWRISKT